MVRGVDQGEAGGADQFKFFDDSAGSADGVEQGGPCWSDGVESDEQEAGWRIKQVVRKYSAQSFRKLRFGEELRAGAAAFELAGPAGEGARVGVGDGGLQTAAGAVVVQQTPCIGGKLSEGVDGAQTERCAVGRVVGRNDLAPEGVLLGGVEQQGWIEWVGGVTVQ